MRYEFKVGDIFPETGEVIRQVIVGYENSPQYGLVKVLNLNRSDYTTMASIYMLAGKVLNIVVYPYDEFKTNSMVNIKAHHTKKDRQKVYRRKTRCWKDHRSVQHHKEVYYETE